MTVAGIMQPYFFPYLGYFSLIRHTDRFVLFDTPQYVRHGWADRNRVLKAGGGWLYIRPALVKAPMGTAIGDMAIDDTQPWRQKIVSQLDGYRKTAPYFRTVRALVEEAIAAPQANLASLAKATIIAVCRYLGIERTFEMFSEMDLSIGPVGAPDEWALEICRAMGVDEYRNPPGGMAFFDPAKYELAGIKLRFLEVNLRDYDQRRIPFEPGLSIIDAMMFNPPETVLAMLDDYRLVEKDAG